MKQFPHAGSTTAAGAHEAPGHLHPSQLQQYSRQVQPTDQLHLLARQAAESSKYTSVQGSPQSKRVVVPQQQPPQHQHQKVVHETFSIHQLERKMMFLNEPGLQMPPNQAQDQIRQLWRLHHQQMQNLQKDSRLQESESQDTIDKPIAKRPESIDEIGGQFGFSTPGQRPKDFDRFQTSVKGQLEELNKAHKDLRKRFKEAGIDVDNDIRRTETLTESLQKVFNDFIACFNQFVQREQRLETLHTQAIRKSKELSKKMQLEVMAQSSQRSQLLAIVDDLTAQLKETKATTVATSSLKTEHASHQQTRQVLEQVQKQNGSLKLEVHQLTLSLQQLGQSGEALKGDKVVQMEEIDSLNGIIQDQEAQLEDVTLRRQQLEQEVSRLKSQVELTQSSKDKIILKLKQEMRQQAHQSAMNNTTMNNTTSYINNNNNATSGMNTSQTMGGGGGGGAGVNKQQINQFQSQLQMRQSQFSTNGQHQQQQPQQTRPP